MQIKDISHTVRKSWSIAQRLPAGKKIFSAFIGRIAPYSGSIGAVIETLDIGYAKLRLSDRRAVRNHLNSVHAMALANLAELTSGLCLMYNLPPNCRGILLGFEISYLKKARGTLFGESRIEAPKDNRKQDFIATVTIRNGLGEEVATAKANWRIGPATDNVK